MKKIIISLLISFVAVSSAFADSADNSKVKQAIMYYKRGSYTDAMQTLEAVTAKDPGNAVAHYYLGMSYVQIGITDKAQKEYESVLSLVPNTQLSSLAQTGINNINPPSADDPNAGIKPTETKQTGFFSDGAKEILEKNKINNVIKSLNEGKDANPSVYKDMKNYEKGLNKSMNTTSPSQEEIAQAMQTLSKAGINPTGSYNPYTQMNPEMMQMNMLMGSMGGGNNNNSQMNMMPLLMMMQNGQNSNVDPQLIQSMMSSMMMPDMMSIYGNNNNNND